MNVVPRLSALAWVGTIIVLAGFGCSTGRISSGDNGILTVFASAKSMTDVQRLCKEQKLDQMAVLRRLTQEPTSATHLASLAKGSSCRELRWYYIWLLSEMGTRDSTDALVQLGGHALLNWSGEDLEHLVSCLNPTPASSQFLQSIPDSFLQGCTNREVIQISIEAAIADCCSAWQSQARLMSTIYMDAGAVTDATRAADMFSLAEILADKTPAYYDAKGLYSDMGIHEAVLDSVHVVVRPIQPGVGFGYMSAFIGTNTSGIRFLLSPDEYERVKGYVDDLAEDAGN